MRYSRQEILEEIGKKGQIKLRNSSVAIVGIGALGTVASEFLARAGLGKLILIDRDFVDMSNLQRQVLFSEDDVGKPKAIQAKAHLEKINNEIDITSHVKDLDFTNSDVLKSDIVIGCTDNFESRFLVNDYCQKNKVPWIYGAAIGTKGYVFNILPGGVCFRCLFHESSNLGTCDTVGIFNVCSGMIGMMLAGEAIKLILGKGFERDLVHYDAWNNEFQKIKVIKKESCPCCNGIYDYLAGKKKSKLVKLCGAGVYQFKDRKIKFNELKKRLKIGLIDSGYCFHYRNITVFQDGRVLVKADDEIKARISLDKIVGK